MVEASEVRARTSTFEKGKLVRFMLRTIVALLCAFGPIALAESAGAEPTHRNEIFPHRDYATYQLRPAVDVPVLLVSSAVAAASLFAEELAPPACATPDNGFVCDPGNLNRVDRGSAQLYDTTWQKVSDLTVPGAILLSLGGLAFVEDFRPFLNDGRPPVGLGIFCPLCAATSHVA